VGGERLRRPGKTLFMQIVVVSGDGKEGNGGKEREGTRD
jgi:hypothetical protein